MFCILCIHNIKVLNKSKIIDMMNNSKISEFKFKKSKNVYTVIFLASLILNSDVLLLK